MTSAGVLAMFSLTGAILLFKRFHQYDSGKLQRVAFHLFGCAIHQLARVPLGKRDRDARVLYS